MTDVATLEKQLTYAQAEARKMRSENERLKRHHVVLLDELKEAQRSLKETRADHAALIDATQPDSQTRLLANLSKLLNPSED